MSRFLFPKWSNLVPTLLALVAGGGLTAVVAGVWYYGTDKYWSVGYEPDQPVDYSHKLHAGEMGIDCRYCHYTVEKAAFAAVPPTQVCMNCHAKVKTDSPKLLPVRESFASDLPIPWIKVHNLPDYVYFNHSAHVGANVGCASCHGRVDQMPIVRQDQPLTMAWCLDCHRDPAPHLRPEGESVTNMAWQPKLEKAGAPAPWIAANKRAVSPPTNCSGCHR